MFEYLGNTGLKQRLIAELEHPAHAYMFSGPKYHYKQRAAIDFAKALLTTDTDPELVLKVVAAGPSNSIKIDQIKSTLNQLILAPARAGDYRIVIILGAEKMTTDASNALLKQLEEPNSGIVFILTTDQASSVLSTINSRVQNIRFSPTLPHDMPPRFKDELTQSEELRRSFDSVNRMCKEFFEGGITQRFIVAKEVYDSGMVEMFIERLGQLMSQSNFEGAGGPKSVTAFLQTEKLIAHNINSRLSIELMALEMA